LTWQVAANCCVACLAVQMCQERPLLLWVLKKVSDDFAVWTEVTNPFPEGHRGSCHTLEVGSKAMVLFGLLVSEAIMHRVGTNVGKNCT
jgi:hypothetical protein